MKIQQPAAGSRSWWKRPLRLMFVVITLLVVLVALLPYALLGVAKKKLGALMTRELGTPCRIDVLHFGWLSGFEIADVEIGNAPGFDNTHPLLRLSNAHADVALLPMLKGQFGIEAEVRGLHLRIDENDDGMTNVEQLVSRAMAQMGSSVTTDDDGSHSEAQDASEVPRTTRRRTTTSRTTTTTTTTSSASMLFFKGRLHLALLDSSIEFRRDGEVLESLLGVNLAIDKDPLSNEVRIRCGALLPAALDGGQSGSISLDGGFDPVAESGTVRMKAKNFDLGRYRSLLETKLEDGAITAFDGVIDGHFEARIGGHEDALLTSNGDLAIRQLHLAGSLFRDVDLRIGSLTIHPGLSTSSRATTATTLDTLLPDSSFDLGFGATDLSIQRGDEILGSFATIQGAVAKGLSSNRLRVQLEAQGMVAAGDAPSFLCTAELDSETKRGRGVVKASAFDLSRYRQLIGAALDQDELSVMQGVVDALLELEMDFGSARRLDINGEVAVAGPHFAGTLLQGMHLQADRWSLKPSLRVLAPDLDGKPRLELGKSSADFGFAQLTSLDEAARKERGIDAGAACTFTADLAALARLGGAFADLAGLSGTTTGLVVLPAELMNGDLEGGLEQLKQLHGIRADAVLAGLSYQGSGLELANATGNASLRDGVLEVRSEPSTLLNRGPLQVQLRADANQPSMPFEFAMSWKAGQVQGESSAVLRYLVPLLAGVSGKSADFQSGIDLVLAVRGNTLRQDDENTLQWLDRWQGDGEITLTNGRLVPAKGLSDLMALLGQPQQLAIDRLGSTFTLQQGAITHRAMRWLSKGGEYGLQGKVHLDGRLELGMDVTSLLQQHKDGAAIAGFLAGSPLQAGIAGTLDAPTFQGPDLGQLLQQALQAAPRKLLEQQGQDLLKKSLDRLFGDKKKK